MPVAKKKTTKRVVKDKKFNQKEVIEKINKTLSDEWGELETPHLRGGDWKWNFESENMSSELAIMWILAGLCILFALFAMHGDQQALNAGLIH